MNWTFFIYIIGSANSFFLGIILLKSGKGKKSANRLLALLLFSWSYAFFYSFYISSGLYREYPFLIMVGASMTFSLGPLLYLYARLMSGRSGQWKNINLLHFMPFFIHTLSQVPFFMKDSSERISSVGLLKDYDSGFFIIAYIQLLHLLIYLILTLLLIRHHTRDIRDTFSSTEKITMSWLRNLIILSFLTMSSYAALLVYYSLVSAEPAFINEVNDIVVIVFIHYLAYRGILQQEIPHVEHGERPRYEKSNLNANKAAELRYRLLEYMDREQPYLDSEISMPGLADSLSVSQHHLSQVINQELGMNFFEFINRYRVEKAKDELTRSLSSGENIIEVAFNSGFNSKSSFNALFREYTGTTPSQYKKQQSA